MSDATQAQQSPFSSRLRQAARAVSRLSLSLLYPPTCIACQAATGEPHGLCAGCWAGMRLIERPFCERLGIPFQLDLGQPLLSPAAIADPPVFQRARAVAEYDGTASLLVHRLKYNDRLELARGLGIMMARAGRELLSEADVIVPVPLHRWRLWRRRFNQAMALAKVVSEESAIPCDPFLLA
ncbi:MAG: double zinc ribbon domain-containing protein, partial [Microvirga sp.]